MAKVDIIVPIYNVGNYIDRTLKSLQKQSFGDIRILCINDGSTDESGEVINRFVQEDVRFLRFDKENGGLSDARNFGLKQVRAPWVMFIDGDDFVEEKMVERCIRTAEQEGSDIVVFPYYQYLLEEERREVIASEVPQGTYALSQRKDLLVHTPNAAWNKMYRTSLFMDNNIRYPYGYRHQDLGTTSKLLALAQKISYLVCPLYNYLLDRPNNITSQVDKKIDHILAMVEEILNWYRQQELFEEYRLELEALCFQNYRNSLRKAVKMADGKFVNQFIDRVFDSYEKYFSRREKNPYISRETRFDFVYENRFWCKCYGLYRRIWR